ncbi:MAG: exosortase T [Myxococcota bacterium]|jgi:exosortase/archaeosortase family protein|nr:exosortase T [Myxococcota bacterium]
MSCTGPALRFDRALIPVALALPGLVALAWDPAVWLFGTWRAPAYESNGAVVALTVVALLALSLASGRAHRDARSARLAFGLLGLAAAIRLAGRVLAVNTIGAFALVVDVAAVASLLRVSARPFALHPGLVAALFAMALPIEHYAQRLLGHPLQLAAATTSHALLAPFSAGLEREGVLLLHPDVVLAIDLPCSGARGLSLYTCVALALWTCHQLKVAQVARLVAAIAGGALFANTARIVALFVGAANGIPVAAEPWHSTLGVFALGAGALPILSVFRNAKRRTPAIRWSFARPPSSSPLLRWPVAVGTSAIGLAIAMAPQHPVDVAPIERDARLPATLGPFSGVDVPLAPNERAFFEQWGGGADKRRYRAGDGTEHTALLVRTRSPLRHLHGPDQCLIGSGHRVTRIGVVPGAVPTVVYKSIAPDGRAWRVQASFASDLGEPASSVSEVVWRWLAEPEVPWNLIERITPWDACADASGACRRFDRALFTSLDLPVEPHERSSS